jgi:hypothetical protein
MNNVKNEASSPNNEAQGPDTSKTIQLAPKMDSV